MTRHESDGTIIAKKVALIVHCLDYGHKYRHELNTEPKCPKCGDKKYETIDEVYE